MLTSINSNMNSLKTNTLREFSGSHGGSSLVEADQRLSGACCPRHQSDGPSESLGHTSGKTFGLMFLVITRLHVRLDVWSSKNERPFRGKVLHVHYTDKCLSLSGSLAEFRKNLYVHTRLIFRIITCTHILLKRAFLYTTKTQSRYRTHGAD